MNVINQASDRRCGLIQIWTPAAGVLAVSMMFCAALSTPIASVYAAVEAGNERQGGGI